MEPRRHTARQPFTSFEKSNIRYWVFVFVLLSAFAAATALLYLSAHESLRDSGFPMLEGGSTVVISLVGLVAIFCLYMFRSQANLGQLRAKLFSDKVKIATLEAQLEELSALFEVGTAINMRLKLDHILKIIVRRLPNCLAADRASLLIVNPSTGLLECRAAWGYGSVKMENYKVAVGEGIAGWVAANGRPLLLHGHELGRFVQYAKKDDDISSAMSVPIKLKNSTVGVLNVTRIESRERFKRKQLHLLCVFAENVAAAIRRALVYEKVDAERLLLEESNKELTNLNQMKEVFLATLSHEFRTPLTCIVSFAELLHEQNSKLSETDRERFTSIMHDQSSKLLNLTEQLMDLSKLEKGSLRLDLEETDVNEIIHSACLTLEPTAKVKGVSLDLDLDVKVGSVRLDSTKVRQIALNLVGNAIKFTDEGGTVVLGTRSRNEWVELSVRDTGVGLDSDEIKRVFDLFAQGSSPTQGRQRGLGLGLYLVKRFVELHKGKVTVESEKGKGATFTVYLPKEIDKMSEDTVPNVSKEEVGNHSSASVELVPSAVGG